MPSILGHSAVGATAAYVYKTRFSHLSFKKFMFASIVVANIPDLDIFLHKSSLGHFEAFHHRSFFHSIAFAALIGLIFGYLIFKNSKSWQKNYLAVYFFLVTISHNLLDALTKGFGVAFFYPFDTHQYNLPVTPLNPAGWTLAEFDANNALGREFFFIWLPMLLIAVFIFLHRRRSSLPLRGSVENIFMSFDLLLA